MHALGKLITEEAEAHNLSLREVATRAGVSKSGLQALVKDDLTEMPKKATLVGIANALKIPQAVVVDAALNTIGLTRVSTEDPELVFIRAGIQELPPGEQERLIKTFRAMLDLSREQS